jgi:tetratricopeptide (TPR) repeat protein
MRFELRILGLGIVLVASTSIAVGRARAQTDDERARTHFEAGRSYYEQAQYADAVREFRESFDLSGRPELLLNISQAEERSLHYAEAITAAQRYLELVPNAEDRKTIEDRIASLQELKRRYEQTGPAPLAPPGSALPSTPASASPAVSPPTAATPAAQPPAPELAAGPRPESSNRFTIPSIVLMGAGGAALVGALVTGLVAHADYRSLERQCRGNLCPRSAEDELDEGKTLSVVSTVLTIVGVVAAGAGGALLIVGAHESSEAPPRAGHLSLGPGVTPLSVSGKIAF